MAREQKERCWGEIHKRSSRATANLQVWVCGEFPLAREQIHQRPPKVTVSRKLIRPSGQVVDRTGANSPHGQSFRAGKGSVDVSGGVQERAPRVTVNRRPSGRVVDRIARERDPGFIIKSVTTARARALARGHVSALDHGLKLEYTGIGMVMSRVSFGVDVIMVICHCSASRIFYSCFPNS